MSPPFTTSITRPSTGSPDSAACSIAFHRKPNRARFARIRRPRRPPREHERIDLVAERDLVGGVDRAAIDSSETESTPSDL